MEKHTKQEMLEQALRGNLASGLWKPGDKLPSETELMQQYHVSRTLVRNVLATLIHDGLIESVHGRGGLVPRKITPTRHTSSSSANSWSRRGI